ncbi:hypothetical protein RI054_03g13530 [Pseudoscourfieldia marina]
MARRTLTRSTNAEYSRDREHRSEPPPEMYEMRDISPPPRDLGTHPLPPNTQCGAVVTVVPSAKESEGSDDSWAGWLEDESEQEECQVEQEEEDASVSPDNAETFVVRRVTYRYRLERGRYVKNGKRLDVQQQGRYFVEKHLNEILSATTGGGGDDDDDEKRRRRRWNNKRR